jgi:thioredoxin-like negative regulator of GroEL
LADEYKDVKIAKVNVDEQQELAGTFQVSSIPVVFFVKDGKVVDRIVGANPPSVYKEKIAEHSKPAKETA